MFLETLRYKLDLQYFAADKGGGTGDEAGDHQPPEEDPEGQKDVDDLEPKKSDETEGDKDHKDDSRKPKKDKVLSQSEVNALIARETKKAQEKLLKQLGVKDVKSAKEGLEKFKEIQESQLTEQQKIAKRAKELEESLTTTQQENGKLKAQLAALKADVDPESLDDVIVLANNMVDDDIDIDTAIKQVLKKYPHFKKQVGNPDSDPEDKKKPKFSSGTHQKKPESEVEKWINAFKI